MDVLPLVVNARHLGKPSVGVEGKIANAESLNVLLGWLESDWVIHLCHLQSTPFPPFEVFGRLEWILESSTRGDLGELIALVGVGLVGNLSEVVAVDSLDLALDGDFPAPLEYPTNDVKVVLEVDCYRVSVADW